MFPAPIKNNRNARNAIGLYLVERKSRIFGSTFVKTPLLGWVLEPTCLVGLGQPDDAAGDAGTGVASGLAQVVAAEAEVVGVGVHDQRTTHDAVGAHQGDLRVLDAHLESQCYN